MAKMGKYCKAYPVNRFREFSGWTENTQNSKESTDKDYLYLQENFVVTDGIFLDENVIFDNVTPEWMDFCKNSLKFEVPFEAPVSEHKPEQAGAGAP
jgi:hypothetical protein